MARPRKYPAWYQRVTLSLPPQLVAELDRFREEQGLERSEVVLSALMAYLTEWTRRHRRAR